MKSTKQVKQPKPTVNQSKHNQELMKQREKKDKWVADFLSENIPNWRQHFQNYMQSTKISY